MKTAPCIGTLIGAATLITTMSASTQAQAHFYLDSPACYSEQDALGDPQKSAPCGTDMALTGAITTYQAGDTVTITIDETIFHPGHYRVALALNDMSELPADPPITPVGNDDCGSTVIDGSIAGVLVDGELQHDTPFEGPQTFTVTLPDDVECDHCVLQILEYMSNHAAPCFYYHCASIAITPQDTTGETDGPGRPDSSTGDDSGDPSTTSAGTTTTSSTSTSGSGNPSGANESADSSSASSGGDTSGPGTDSAAGTGADGGDSTGGGGCSVSGAAPSPQTWVTALGLIGLFRLRRRRMTTRSALPRHNGVAARLDVPFPRG